MLKNTGVKGMILMILSVAFSLQATAQLMAYGGRQTDNKCKTVYLVNPSADSIYYVAGTKDMDLTRCQTFQPEARHGYAKCTINVSDADGSFFLLLPKDTLTYNIIMSCPGSADEKYLLLSYRYSPAVINTNEEKKRNRQIRRLKGDSVAIPVIE